MHNRQSKWLGFTLAAVLCGATSLCGVESGAALAQSPAAKTGASESDPAVVKVLTRATLSALQQANNTGEFSVLYMLTSPTLRNSASLETFIKALTPLREKNVDLYPALIFEPQFANGTGLDDKGILRIRGAVNTGTTQIRFNLSYSFVGSRWLIDGMAVDVVPSNTPVAPPTSAAPLKAPAAAAPRPAAPKAPPSNKAPKPSEYDRATDPPTTTKY